MIGGDANATTTTVAGETTTSSTTTTAEADASTTVKNWTAEISDPVSSGFTVKLAGGAGQLAKTQVWSDVGCLETVGESMLGRGTDSASGGEVAVPVTFNMTGAAATFSVRCGTGGRWIAGSQRGGSFSASYSFTNVTVDETVYLRS